MTTLLSFLQGFFANKLLEDDREPFLQFYIPGIDGELAILAPRMEFWFQLAMLLLIQTIIACLFAVVIYKYIVQQRRTMGAYLLGFGIVIPVACHLPFRLLEVMGIENRVLKMSCTTLACVVSFRCVEAMYETSLNTAVEASLSNYVLYYSSLVNPVWDTKTNQRVRVTRKEVLCNLWTIVCQYLILSVVLSYLLAFDFQPFASNVHLEQFYVSWDLLQPGQLANNYLVAVLTFYTLCVGFNLTGFVNNLQGYSVRDVLYNPLLRTESPSDFWGRKWNPVIGGALKRAAFLPVRQYCSAPIAIVATFVLSGVLHDYSWACIFYHYAHKYDVNGECLDCFLPIFWKQTAFFVYCGITMLLEKAVAKLTMVQWISKNLPLPIVSTLVILTVLPVSHWYTGDWIIGGYFNDFPIGLFYIVKVSS